MLENRRNIFVPEKQNLLFIVLDSLRFDVAQQAFEKNLIPNFSKFLPKTGWEKRYSPGSFTYPSHKAFFAGFLPTRMHAKHTPRIFAPAFLGSESSDDKTFLFQEANIVEALNNRNFETVCIGGVGFFNSKTAISSEFPDLFTEKYWSEEMSVVSRNSTELQFDLAARRIESSKDKVFCFINVSAIHQPNYYYSRNEKRDDKESHLAALEYVDKCIPKLLDAAVQKGPFFVIICSDHGTSYGENGLVGHRNGSPEVMEVPYIDFCL